MNTYSKPALPSRKLLAILSVVFLVACSTSSESRTESISLETQTQPTISPEPGATIPDGNSANLTPAASEGDLELPEYRYTVLDAAIEFCGDFPAITVGLARNDSEVPLGQMKIYLRDKNSGEYYIDPDLENNPGLQDDPNKQIWSIHSWHGFVLPGEQTIFHRWDVRQHRCDDNMTQISGLDELPFEIELYSDPISDHESRLPYRQIELTSVEEQERTSLYLILNASVVNTGDQIAGPYLHWLAYSEEGKLISVGEPKVDPTGVSEPHRYSYLHPGTAGMAEIYLPAETANYEFIVLAHVRPNVIPKGEEDPPPPDECIWRDGEGVPILTDAQSVKTDGPSTYYGINGLIDDVIYCYKEEMASRGYQLVPGYEEEFWDSELLPYSGPDGGSVFIEISIKSTLSIRTDPHFIWVVLHNDAYYD